MITRDLLRSLRNDLPMAAVFQHLGGLAPYSKWDEDRFRFVCQACGELQAIVNPRNNLAHCFACGKNTNTIDLLLASGYEFKTAVELLRKWLSLQKREQSGMNPVSQTAPSARTEQATTMLGAILQQECGPPRRVLE